MRSNPRSEKLKEAVLGDIKDAVVALQQRREALQKALDVDEAQHLSSVNTWTPVFWKVDRPLIIAYPWTPKL